MVVMLAGTFAGSYALFKRRGLAIAITVVLGGFLFGKHWVFQAVWLQVLFGALTAAVGMVVLLRFGVLAGAVFAILAYGNAVMPVTFDPKAWYAGGSVAYVAAFLALLWWGWRAATMRPPAPSATGSSASGSPGS